MAAPDVHDLQNCENSIRRQDVGDRAAGPGELSRERGTEMAAKNGNKTIISILIPVVVVLIGGVFGMAQYQTSTTRKQIDTVKTDHAKAIDCNKADIKEVKSDVVDLKLGQVQTNAKLDALDEKIDILLRANGVPDHMIPKARTDTVNHENDTT